jgi:hypothetical protein
MYKNGWTYLKVGEQLLMKDDQASLQHHKQMATMLKLMIKEDRGITVSEIVLIVGFSYGSSCAVTTKNFLFFTF